MAASRKEFWIEWTGPDPEIRPVSFEKPPTVPYMKFSDCKREVIRHYRERIEKARRAISEIQALHIDDVRGE